MDWAHELRKNLHLFKSFQNWEDNGQKMKENLWFLVRSYTHYNWKLIELYYKHCENVFVCPKITNAHPPVGTMGQGFTSYKNKFIDSSSTECLTSIYLSPPLFLPVYNLFIVISSPSLYFRLCLMWNFLKECVG